MMVWVHVYVTRWDNVRSEVYETKEDADDAARRRDGLHLPQQVIEVIL